MSFLSQLQLSAANAKQILVPGSECETLHWFRLCNALHYRGKRGIKTSNPITVAPELMVFHVPQASLAHIPSGSHHWATVILWPASLRTLQASTDTRVCVLSFYFRSLHSLRCAHLHARTQTNVFGSDLILKDLSRDKVMKSSMSVISCVCVRLDCVICVTFLDRYVHFWRTHLC